MADADDLRALALGLEGVTEAPHFDRTAFRRRLIFVTLAADGRSANLRLDPDQQEFKLMLLPEALAPVQGAWGRQGWTTAELSRLGIDDLDALLRLAYDRAGPKSPARKR